MVWGCCGRYLTLALEYGRGVISSSIFRLLIRYGSYIITQSLLAIYYFFYLTFQ